MLYSIFLVLLKVFFLKLHLLLQDDVAFTKDKIWKIEIFTKHFVKKYITEDIDMQSIFKHV